jgi:hypothetical protein
MNLAKHIVFARHVREVARRPRRCFDYEHLLTPPQELGRIDVYHAWNSPHA